MEHQLYPTVLLIAGGVNLLIAFVLLHSNVWFRNYDVYRRARQLVALCYIIFALGFILHAHFEWRTTWPAAATALSVSYFHIGGVLFSWSHTSLLNSRYLTRGIVVRDIAILAVALVGYWTAAANHEPCIMNYALMVFFLHVVWLAFVFYRTYYRVSRRLIAMQRGTAEQFVRWMLRSCHLIILFGVGSVTLTAFVSTALWPYTLLLCCGIGVFFYIFYSLTEYGFVIDQQKYENQ